MPNDVDEGDMNTAGNASEPAHEVPAEDVEARAAQAARIPYAPSAKDIARHNTTHLQYRDWCPICVRACGVFAPHFKDVDRSDHSVAAVCADDCFVCRDPKLEEEAEAEEKDEDDGEDKPEGDAEIEDRPRKERATILNIKDVVSS